VRLTLFGTQGWIPTTRRHTTCIAVDHGPRLLIFDAGTGLSRLLDQPARSMLKDADDIHLFLTHYHLDHSCGLAYVPGIFAGRPLTVHVPDAGLNGVDPEKGIAELIRPPYNPRPWRELPDVTISVLNAGANEVAGHRIDVRPQPHADTSVAYRLDDTLVLATDTTADPATADFARGAGILLHEAWIDGVEEDDPNKQELVRTTYASHSSARQVAGLTAQAGVEELVLMHLNPFFPEGYYRQMEMSARDIFASTSVYPDLYQRELGGSLG
jgi:ribonuclease BN (tRNA processing enzyme)